MLGDVPLLSRYRDQEDAGEENNKRLLRTDYAVFGDDVVQIFPPDANLPASDRPDTSVDEMVPRSFRDRSTFARL